MTPLTGWLPSGAIVVLITLTGCGTPQGGLGMTSWPQSSGTETVVSLVMRSPRSMLPVPPTAIRRQVTLPLYPGSEKTSHHMPYPVHPTVGNPYVLTGRSRFVLPANSSKVTAWVQQKFLARHWPPLGTGSAGNVNQSTSETDLSFGAQPGENGVAVTVDLYPLGSSRTLMEYWVTDLVVPPRPAASMIPPNVSRVAVTVQGKNLSLTSPLALKTLRDAVNGRRHLAVGTVMCPNVSGPSVKLTFYRKSGGPIVVRAAPRCTDQVGTLSLWDVKGVVWHSLKASHGARSPLTIGRTICHNGRPPATGGDQGWS